LEEFLARIHTIHRDLTIAAPEFSSTGQNTDVVGRQYPAFLQPWKQFEKLHQEAFAFVQHTLRDKQLFPEPKITSYLHSMTTEEPAGFEVDINRFSYFAVERSIQEILRALVHADASAMSTKFDFSSLRFLPSERGLKQPAVANGNGQPKNRTRPDGFAFRTTAAGQENLTFCLDYKAAHKLLADQLKPALAKETLFADVVRRMSSRHVLAGGATEERIAMALIQVFSYMLQRGIAYGYVAGGNAVVLLYVDLDNPKTLHYHLCVPPPDGAPSKTILAQIASFCLISFRSQPVTLFELKRLKEHPDLQPWPQPYREHLNAESSSSQTSSSQASSSQASQPGDRYVEKGKKKAPVINVQTRAQAKRRKEAEAARQEKSDDDDNHGDNRRSAAAGKGGSTVQPEGQPSSHGSPARNTKPASLLLSSLVQQPTRRYCTQACLLGLKRGSPIDDGCPNAPAHRTASDTDRHAIGAAELTALVRKQLSRSVY